MLEVKIEPRDLLELDLALTKLDAEHILKGEWVPFIDNVVEVVSVYPPVPQDSKYLRTGDLFVAWHAEVVNPLMAQVQNVAEYAGYVQGHEQTAQHKGTGWIELHKKASDMLDIFADKLWQKIETIWQGGWND